MPDATSAAPAPSQSNSDSTESAAAAESDAAVDNPDVFAALPMDAEWLNDTSTLIPPNAQPDDEFSYSFTIQPSARNYINAKPPKSVNASDDPYSATPPQLQPQLVKCNSVDDLRRIIFQRFSRALIGRALCDKMDVLLKPGNGRSKADVVGEWQLKAVTVVDMVNYFSSGTTTACTSFAGRSCPPGSPPIRTTPLFRAISSSLSTVRTSNSALPASDSIFN